MSKVSDILNKYKAESRMTPSIAELEQNYLKQIELLKELDRALIIEESSESDVLILARRGDDRTILKNPSDIELKFLYIAGFELIKLNKSMVKRSDNNGS